MFKEKFKSKELCFSLKAAIAQVEKAKAMKRAGMGKTKNQVKDHLKEKKTLLAEVCVLALIEAENSLVVMEIIHVLCDLLYKKAGLLESKQDIEDVLSEAVSTLIWAAPYLKMEIPELEKVAHQLCLKYSNEYGNQCRSGKTGSVNKIVMQKLREESPSKSVKEKYLCDIAKEAGIEYQPEVLPMDDMLGATNIRRGEVDARTLDRITPYPSGRVRFPSPDKSDFPNAGNIMIDIGFKENPTDNLAPTDVPDLSSPRGRFGFKREMLLESQDPGNLPDLTSNSGENLNNDDETTG